MRNIFIALLFFFPFLAQAQQSDSIMILMPVADAFTKDIIYDGGVEVLRTDSTYVCRGEWGVQRNDGIPVTAMIEFKVPCNGNYLLRLSHEKYETLYYPVKVQVRKDAQAACFDDVIKMRKRPKNHQLGEAVVTATKIKMVMKNDTLVYNADAFQLSQGSMLDALIEQLPGVQLKDNGVITVNGKMVSSLLVNGKDFFRGDPKVALENLPAYMVNKVKVYEQESDFEKFSGHKEVERPIVMDVNLKKQYSVGWIANAEAAYGTKEKYLGRLFAMRFTACSRLAMYGNINNTNDTRRAGSKGEWTPSNLPNGVQTNRTAGAEYFYENRNKTFEWTSDVTVTDLDNHTVTNTSSESFLPLDHFYTQSRSDGNHSFTSLQSNHNFKVQKKAHQNGGVSVYYYKSRYHSLSRYGGFNNDPYDYVVKGKVLDTLFMPGNNKLLQIARYRRAEQYLMKSDYWSVSAPYSLWISPFRNKGRFDTFTFDIYGSYDKYNYHAYDTYDLEYFNTQAIDDYRNRYYEKPASHYNYYAKAAYRTMFGAWQPNVSYCYTQDYRSGSNDLYRLDRLEGWGKDGKNDFATLPSTSTELQEALDVQNSTHTERWKRTHDLVFSLACQFKNRSRTHLSFGVPVKIELEHLLYNRDARHYDVCRSKPMVNFNGRLQHNVFFKGGAINFKLYYDLSHQQADLLKTIEVVDNSNPLYIQQGNASLQTAVVHKLTLDALVRTGDLPLCNVKMSYLRTHNALGTERTFVPVTGGYIVRPVNVNGNWGTDGSVAITRNVGKKKLFTLSNTVSYTFNHSVDMANVDGATDNALSVFKNLYLHEQLSLDYSKNGWNIGAKARASYSHLAGNRADFNTINAWDYNYGITARIPIPGGIGLSTDFTIFSRRGYDDPSLNSDDVVWNMRLERSVLNGNLTFAVDGFDILHNLSKVTRTVNAQGRIESYSNVLPSYFMAHVIYKLNIQPKKKK